MSVTYHELWHVTRVVAVVLEPLRALLAQESGRKRHYTKAKLSEQSNCGSRHRLQDF